MDLVDTNDFDGINIDFESGAATDRAAMTSFIQDLGGQRARRGQDAAVCVAAAYYNQLVGRQGFYDYKALGAAADHVFVMGWGYTGPRRRRARSTTSRGSSGW